MASEDAIINNGNILGLQQQQQQQEEEETEQATNVGIDIQTPIEIPADENIFCENNVVAVVSEKNDTKRCKELKQKEEDIFEQQTGLRCPTDEEDQDEVGRCNGSKSKSSEKVWPLRDSKNILPMYVCLKKDV